MKKIFNFIFCILISFCFAGCRQDEESCNSYTVVTATQKIKNRAFEFAKLYQSSETEYVYGAQDPLRSIKIDCSGLVIMCYKYALVDTKYTLVVSDMSSSYIYENASKITDSPEQGDLIFMGEENSDRITHIAIFDKEENGNIYFIDSTENDTINGVSQRYYEKNNPKFKAFGIMKLKLYK